MYSPWMYKIAFYFLILVCHVKLILGWPKEPLEGRGSYFFPNTLFPQRSLPAPLKGALVSATLGAGFGTRRGSCGETGGFPCIWQQFCITGPAYPYNPTYLPPVPTFPYRARELEGKGGRRAPCPLRPWEGQCPTARAFLESHFLPFWFRPGPGKMGSRAESGFTCREAVPVGQRQPAEVRLHLMPFHRALLMPGASQAPSAPPALAFQVAPMSGLPVCLLELRKAPAPFSLSCCDAPGGLPCRLIHPGWLPGWLCP